MLATTETAREVIAMLVKKHPGETRDALFEHFRTSLATSDAKRRSVEWFFFVSMYEQIVAPGKRAPVQNEAGIKRIKSMAAEIKRKILLLDLTMPNGKLLRDCTGAECAKFGNRFRVIADRVGKTKLVGEILSEVDVEAIMTGTVT